MICIRWGFASASNILIKSSPEGDAGFKLLLSFISYTPF
ncbi:hypothetical protein DCCM_2137 [Desulfocucumis palustris]|uniref:Uncharacterized protein n=1 Tax=Desulfocucumis palustris TaxID=1898651 RepID=A0A2L2XAD6_9FIRM|nr:hypothetical protein DCCM_2137 [Desulfocucumis palustris]